MQPAIDSIDVHGKKNERACLFENSKIRLGYTLDIANGKNTATMNWINGMKGKENERLSELEGERNFWQINAIYALQPLPFTLSAKNFDDWECDGGNSDSDAVE